MRFARVDATSDPDSGYQRTRQFPEILPEEVLAKMHAEPKADVPIADVHDLPNYDGFILGFPTRCVAVPALN